MPQQSYARFWAAFNRLAAGGCDREELKADLCLQFSLNRTDSLRQLTEAEYLHLCEGVERLAGQRQPSSAVDPHLLRRHRSACLHQLQLYGVRTSSWEAVDQFCLDHRIAGKRFASLTIPELDALTTKMRVIRRKSSNSHHAPP